jgi:hypothetical protein
VAYFFVISALAAIDNLLPTAQHSTHTTHTMTRAKNYEARTPTTRAIIVRLVDLR